VPVAKWFVKKRGRALALSTVGLGTGGIAFMPLTQMLINTVGWRDTWLILAIISVSITVPVTVLFLRRQPEDMGLLPDGESPAPTVRGRRLPRLQESLWTAKQALRTNAFWLLILYFGLIGLAAGGGSVHRLPYWVEKGFDPQLVSYSFAADAAGAAAMALGAGFLVDRFPVRFVAIASCFGFIGAILIMLMANNTLLLFASTTLFGLSVGVNMIVTSFIWADYYGRAFLGTIRGIVLPASLIAAGVGAPVAGYIYDRVGNYQPVWWILIAIYSLAALVVVKAVAPTSPQEQPSEGS
jgi:MFS family permease